MHGRTLRWTATVLLVLGAHGCAWTRDRVPEAPIELARADYRLGPETTGFSCRGYAFGIAWGALLGRDTTWHRSAGVVGILTGASVTPEAEEAMFLALAREDEATHLVAPRVRSTFEGFGTVGLPLFGKRCGSVWARTATIGEPLRRVLADRQPRRDEPRDAEPEPPADTGREASDDRELAPSELTEEERINDSDWSPFEDVEEEPDDTDEEEPEETPWGEPVPLPARDEAEGEDDHD